jgi:hypothetical protein
MSMMPQQQWYIQTSSGEEGPLTLDQLRCHPELTPDTWVRRIDHKVWQRARNVPELGRLLISVEPSVEKSKPTAKHIEELTLQIDQEPPSYLIWLLLLLALMCYIIYHFTS